MAKDKSNSPAAQELDRVQKQFDAFDDQIKSLTQDRMNEAPKQEIEEQTKIASRDIDKSKEIWLKPIKAHPSREKFNEKYRESINFDKQYVQFIAENYELIGESIDIWTKPYPGMPAEEWLVPTNKPVWGPRYLAEQIKRKNYHVLKMENSIVTGQNKAGTMYGQMAVDTTKQRLDARPVSTRKSIFMGERSF
jgi:flagellar biosynthesis chaperone FliJ